MRIVKLLHHNRKSKEQEEREDIPKEVRDGVQITLDEVES